MTRNSQGNKPLAQVSVVVTRPPAQSQPLSELLANAGARVLQWPAFTIAEVRSGLEMISDALGRARWIVFTSANAVGTCGEMIRSHRKRFSIASVGPATTAALAGFGLEPEVEALTSTAEGLVEALGEREIELRQCTVLFPRARDARSTIESGLKSLGAHVESVVVYEAVPAEEKHRIPGEGVDVVTFASSSAARYFEHIVFADDLQWFKETPVIACIGPSTAFTAREHSYNRVVTAGVHTSAGLVASIIDYWSKEN